MRSKGQTSHTALAYCRTNNNQNTLLIRCFRTQNKRQNRLITAGRKFLLARNIVTDNEAKQQEQHIYIADRCLGGIMKHFESETLNYTSKLFQLIIPIYHKTNSNQILTPPKSFEWNWGVDPPPAISDDTIHVTHSIKFETIYYFISTPLSTFTEKACLTNWQDLSKK